MNYPKISIVTPSYNQGEYLEQTIKSVLDQNYPNLEYIIMDGGSTDNSVEIIKKYEGHLTYWQSKPDGGQSSAINEGFRHATGEIYAWLNSDDQYIENALLTVGKYFSRNKDCMWCAGTGVSINSKGKVLSKIVPNKLDFKTLCQWKDNGILQPSVFFRNNIWEKIDGLNCELENAMDFDLWLKFTRFSKGTIIDKVLSRALYHKNMKTFKNAHLSFTEVCLILCQHGEFYLAKKQLSRVVKRAYEVNKILSIITKNPLYRKWRDKKEN